MPFGLRKAKRVNDSANIEWQHAEKLHFSHLQLWQEASASKPCDALNTKATALKIIFNCRSLDILRTWELFHVPLFITARGISLNLCEVPFVLLTLLNLLSLALCVSELPHTRLLADLYLCLKRFEIPRCCALSRWQNSVKPLISAINRVKGGLTPPLHVKHYPLNVTHYTLQLLYSCINRC